MTDLLTRIRAHVAAIPTHVCLHCDHEQTPLFDGPTGCERCGGSRITPIRLHEYDALLREVAALEPVSYVASIHLAHMTDGGEEILTLMVDGPRANMPLTALYTLTGATHAPE